MIPIGICQCGCGERTRIATYNHGPLGYVKGRPLRYLQYHRPNKSSVEYVEEDRGYKTKCWIWQRGFSGDYGAVGVSKGGGLAHRYMYEKIIGPIPNGFTLDHLCRVPACVNPEHLEPVTNAENSWRGMRTKLAKHQVMEIRQLRLLGLSYADIGMVFEIHRETVRQICLGLRWRDFQPTMTG